MMLKYLCPAPWVGGWCGEKSNDLVPETNYLDVMAKASIQVKEMVF